LKGPQEGEERMTCLSTGTLPIHPAGMTQGIAGRIQIREENPKLRTEQEGAANIAI